VPKPPRTVQNPERISDYLAKLCEWSKDVTLTDDDVIEDIKSLENINANIEKAHEIIGTLYERM